MFQLPVSGLIVAMRLPTGKEDLFLREAQMSPIATALALAESLVEAASKEPTDWRDLTLTDLEAVMLMLRRMVLGNSLRAEARCHHAPCGARVDVDFPVDHYLKNKRPRTPPGIEGPDQDGWFRLDGEGIRFRLPRCRDLLEIVDRARSARERRLLLMRKCTEPAELSAGVRRRVERAIEVLVAPLSGDLTGVCPECNHRFTIRFDVVQFVLDEMRSRSKGIYEDIHLLALHYKWAEEKILALPGQRRLQYAEMIRSERNAA